MTDDQEPLTTRDEFEAAIRSSLLVWVEAGVPSPKIPCYEDQDKDGHPDFWVLHGEGIRRIDAGDADFDSYTDVSVSTGDGFETEWEGDQNG